MVCTIVAGAFWGDEGKGKIVSYLALKDLVDVCVRVGSVNAGHTVIHGGKRFTLHMVPSAFVHEKCRLLIGPGANLHVPRLFEEIRETETANRIGVDAQCSVIEEKHSTQDKTNAHLKGLGTTGWGVGPALEERVRRTAKLARDIPALQPYLADVAMEVNEAIDNDKNVLIEGVQGFFLSLFHGTYPYVTGRDTTSSAILSEAGVGPCKADHVLLVYKAYMTRVGAGPLPGELSKEETVNRGWLEISATGRERRAAPFDFYLAKRAAIVNGATEAAVTKLDLVFPACRNMTSYDGLPKEAKDFIVEIEKQVGVPVVLIGTGPSALDIIDRRK